MKKKIFLLPALASLVLSGCSFNDVFNSIGNFFKGIFGKNEEKGEVIPPDTNTHANKITLSPNAPFYLKVGESRNISIGYDYKPTLDSERIFTWSYTGNNISLHVDGNDSTAKSIKGGDKATVTGLNAGTTQIWVKNTYNESLTDCFTVNVIDFDEDKDYLWQYSSDNKDREKFGYNSSTAKQGVREGDAGLNGVVWQFNRSDTTSLQSKMGSVGFGKGDAPETLVHFETTTDRVVKDFIIETASANSLATLTIKVNNVVYPLDPNGLVDGKIPRPYYDEVGSVSTTGVGTEKGKIELDFSTPAYDETQKDNPEYKSPGALWLKSILIHFDDLPEDASTEVFDFKGMYDNTSDGIFDSLSDSTKSSQSFTQGDFDVYLNGVKKETSDDSIPGYVHSNDYIDVKLNRSNEVISKVELKVQYGTASSKNRYQVGISKIGGAPFKQTCVFNSKDTGLLKLNIYTLNINSIRLIPEGNNHVGLDNLKVYTKQGINPTIKPLEQPIDLTPSVKNYLEDDFFDPTGLKNLTIEFNEDVEPESLSPKELDWYDGVLYDSNPRVLSKQLVEGTTYVKGVFRDEVIAKVSGLTVVAGEKVTLTLVKDKENITANDKYLIVGKFTPEDSPTTYTCLNGAGTTNDEIKNGYVLNNFAFNDSVELSYKIESRCFTASFDENSKLLLNSGDYKVGLANSGTLSCTKSPAILGWDYDIDEQNRLIMSMVDKESTPKTKYFGINNKTGVFSSYAQAIKTGQGEVFLYKLSSSN